MNIELPLVNMQYRTLFTVIGNIYVYIFAYRDGVKMLLITDDLYMGLMVVEVWTYLNC